MHAQCQARGGLRQQRRRGGMHAPDVVLHAAAVSQRDHRAIERQLAKFQAGGARERNCAAQNPLAKETGEMLERSRNLEERLKSTTSEIEALRRSLEEVRVYSRYPWPGREKGGPQDEFERVALDWLEANARPEHIVRLTWYVLDKQEYLDALKEVGAAYRELMGRHFPAMAVVQVSGLMEDLARLEIEATAVVPADPNRVEAAI